MKVVKKPIEIIAYFTKDGDLNPIKFRMVAEDESWITIKIDRIISKELEKLAGNKMMVYTCQSTINKVAKVYQIKYELETTKWILFKI